MSENKYLVHYREQILKSHSNLSNLRISTLYIQDKTNQVFVIL